MRPNGGLQLRAWTTIVCLAVTFPALAGTWTIETVDNAVFLGRVSLAYDPIDRHPSIAYWDDTGKTIYVKFAHWDGTRWVIEVIGPAHKQVALAYHPVTGQPTVAYAAPLAKTKWGLVLATRSPTGTWTKETVEPVWSPNELALAYDHAGVPAIAYRTTPRSGSSTLNYTRKLGTSWPKQVVATAGFERLSLAFDPSNLPAIAYNPHDPTQFCLGLASWNGSSWTTELVECGLREEGPWGYGNDPWLSYSPNGEPAIASTGGGSVNRPRYSRKAGSWATEVIDPTPSSGSGAFSPSLAFTGDGVPYVSFVSEEGAVHELRLAHLEGTTWVVEPVAAGDLKYQSHLAFDPSGAPTVAFGGTAQDLKFARRTGP